MPSSDTTRSCIVRKTSENSIETVRAWRPYVGDGVALNLDRLADLADAPVGEFVLIEEIDDHGLSYFLFPAARVGGSQ